MIKIAKFYTDFFSILWYPLNHGKKAIILISKKRWIQCLLLVFVMMVCGWFLLPVEWEILLGLLFLFLCVGLINQGRKNLALLKQLDQKEDYPAVLHWVKQLETKGYCHFVYDSYRLYAYYMLGMFADYRSLAKRMHSYREWKRPKHQRFVSQVEDNLALLDCLALWAESGEVHYQGRQALFIQATAYYQQNEPEKIAGLYPKEPLPLLKEAFLLALQGQFEKAQALYNNQEAKELFENIKGRLENGKSEKE